MFETLTHSQITEKGNCFRIVSHHRALVLFVALLFRKERERYREGKKKKKNHYY